MYTVLLTVYISHRSYVIKSKMNFLWCSMETSNEKEISESFLKQDMSGTGMGYVEIDDMLRAIHPVLPVVEYESFHI